MKALLFRSKSWVGAVAGVFFALDSTASWAYCKPMTPGVPRYNFSVPTLSIPRDTPNGTEIYRSDTISLGAIAAIICDAPGASGYRSIRGATGNSDPSPIGSSGLGWRLWIDNDYAKQYPSGKTYYKGGPYETNRKVGIVLYKMSEISSVDAGVLGHFYVQDQIMYSIALDNSINAVVRSCETPSINVNLGPQYSGKFKGVGSTIGERNFSIKLNNCPAGINSISYRLDPVNTALDAKSGILALDPNGATGVGIKIMDDNGASVGLGEIRKFLSNVSAGNHTIPLKAAYYKSSDSVTGGAANASMQFTIIYQ
ncbi:fimbrial protein [Pseudomonas sp. BNK-6]|uniref:fimbrial protein n=1 Tax=unclassified Pseudomonas TaxID=196821 RepID=UPI003A898BD3